jgi:hypothetical protein
MFTLGVFGIFVADHHQSRHRVTPEIGVKSQLMIFAGNFQYLTVKMLGRLIPEEGRKSPFHHTG